jgi:hypothetical protein
MQNRISDLFTLPQLTQLHVKWRLQNQQMDTSTGCCILLKELEVKERLGEGR